MWASDIGCHTTDYSLKASYKMLIPDSIEYSKIKGLSNEAKEKLEASRPQNLGQAANIPGLSSSAITLVKIHLKKNNLT